MTVDSCSAPVWRVHDSTIYFQCCSEWLWSLDDGGDVRGRHAINLKECMICERVASEGRQEVDLDTGASNRSSRSKCSVKLQDSFWFNENYRH